jgi:hypothetical protein
MCGDLDGACVSITPVGHLHHMTRCLSEARMATLPGETPVVYCERPGRSDGCERTGERERRR